MQECSPRSSNAESRSCLGTWRVRRLRVALSGVLLPGRPPFPAFALAPMCLDQTHHCEPRAHGKLRCFHNSGLSCILRLALTMSQLNLVG